MRLSCTQSRREIEIMKAKKQGGILNVLWATPVALVVALAPMTAFSSGPEGKIRTTLSSDGKYMRFESCQGDTCKDLGDGNWFLIEALEKRSGKMKRMRNMDNFGSAGLHGVGAIFTALGAVTGVVPGVALGLLTQTGAIKVQWHAKKSSEARRAFNAVLNSSGKPVTNIDFARAERNLEEELLRLTTTGQTSDHEYKSYRGGLPMVFTRDLKGDGNTEEVRFAQLKTPTNWEKAKKLFGGSAN